MTPNLKYLYEICNDNSVIVAKLLCSLQKEFPILIKNYIAAHISNDHKKAANSVHKMINSLALLNLHDKIDIVRKHEYNLKENDWQLHLEFKDIIENVDLFLRTKT